MEATRSERDRDLWREMRGIQEDAGQPGERNRVFTGSLRVGLQYDSNVGLFPDNEAFIEPRDLKSTGEDEAGVIEAHAGFQPETKGALGFRGDYYLYTDFHKDLNDYNILDQMVTLEPLFRVGKTRISVPVSYSYVMEDYARELSGFYVKPAVTVGLGKSHMARFYGTYSDVSYARDDSDILQEDQSATSYGGGAAYIFSFRSNAAFLKLDGGFRANEAKGDNWDYDSRMLALSLRVPVVENLVFYGSTSLDLRDFSNVHSTYDKKRDDTRVTAYADLNYELKKRYDLFASYTIIHSDSNLPAYDYDRHVVTVGVGVHF